MKVEYFLPFITKVSITTKKSTKWKYIQVPMLPSPNMDTAKAISSSCNTQFSWHSLMTVFL